MQKKIIAHDAANDTPPNHKQEQELISILLADPATARKIVLQRDALERTHFQNSQHGCAYGALATLTQEQKSFELQDVRTLLSTWAIDTEQPDNALLALDAAQAFNNGKYSNGTPPTFDRARELANSIKAAAPKPKRKPKPAKQKIQAQVIESELPLPAETNERSQSEYSARQIVQLLYPAWHHAALETNAAHARRIVENEGDNLKYSAELGFLLWNGCHWERDDKTAKATSARAASLSQTVREEAAQLYQFAAELTKAARPQDANAMARAAKSHQKHAKKVEQSAFIKDSLHLAAGALKVEPAQFDQKPWLLALQNLTWHNGKLRTHRRDDFILNLCPVAIAPHADQSEWLAVLERMTGGDTEYSRTLQDAAGYILSGASHLRFIPWLYGPKGTGKSTFAELLQTVLGHLAATIDPKKLQADAARERLGADLWNKRLAVCAEAGSQKLEAELLKTLSGSDTLTVRFLYHESFNALPRHVLMMVANDPPRVDADDDALKDRVVALPFIHPLASPEPFSLTGGARIEAVRQDPTAPLVTGFAAWALEGLTRVYETQSIHRAPIVEAATRRFWQDTDPISAFWETLEESELRAGIAKKELRTRYETWCETEGERPYGRVQWARACKSHDLEEARDDEKNRIWKLWNHKNHNLAFSGEVRA